MKKYVIILVLSFIPFSVKAEGSNTLPEVLKDAYANNPTIAAARRELESVREQLPQALAGWRPNVQIDLSSNVIDSEFRLSGSRVEGDIVENTGTLLVTQPIFNGGSTFAQRKYAKKIINAQEYAVIATEQDILRDVATAYMDVVRDESLLRLSRNNRGVINKQLDATEDNFDVGSATKTDVKQSEARLAGAEAEVIRIEGQLATSKSIFKRLVGHKPSNLRNVYKTPTIPSNLDEAIAMALENSPNVKIAKIRHDAQQNNIDVISGELMPQISARGSYSLADDPYPGTYNRSEESRVGIYATIPLYKSGSTRSRIREQERIKEQLAFQLEEAERLVEQQVIAAWREYKAAEAEINARRKQVEANRVAKEGVYKEAEVGNRTVLDKLDADQELLDAEANLVTAERNKIVATYKIAALLANLSVTD